MKIGLAIMTRNAETTLEALLDTVDSQSCILEKKLLVDSTSTDRTQEIGRAHGLTVFPVEQNTFNHGSTRQQAAAALQAMDVIVFMTQDALLADKDSLQRLTAVFADNSVGAAYGRQLPHAGASPLAAHARHFNYGEKSIVKSYEDRKRLGIKAPFMSDSFAAYRVSALTEAGGFPHVIVSEDMYVGARLLQKKYKIAYAADAAVYHSHDYTLVQEFRRYFDNGVFQSEQPWIRDTFGAAEGEGLRFVKSQLTVLWQSGAYGLMVKSFFLNIMKFLGYRLGMLHRSMPTKLKKICSAQSFYFTK